MVIKSRKMRWAGRVACIREMTKAYELFVGKSEGKRSLLRSRHR